MPDDSPDRDLKRRDVLILKELAANPQRSAREITEVLAKDHGVDVSHATVSKSIRRMREDGVYREAVIPNEEYFIFEKFEFKFNPEYFAEEWRDAMEHIRDHENTLFFFLSDGEYQWTSIMMFPNREAGSKWIHEFYKEHGKVVNNLRNSVMTNVLSFGTDPRLFDGIPTEDER